MTDTQPGGNVCRVLMAIDASGSMHYLEDDVIGGYNGYLDGLAADTGTSYYISTALFNTSVRMLCESEPVATAPRLDRENYSPQSGTALLDAIGDLVGSLTTVDKDDRVLVVVNTDGQENSSREWTQAGIRKLVDSKSSNPRWGFVFLGAGPDVWKQGHGYGFASNQTVSSSGGTRSAYRGMTANTTSYAAGQTTPQQVADNISAESMAADAEAPNGE